MNLNVPFAAEKARISVGVKAKSNKEKAELADFKLLDTTAELYITRDKILFSDVELIDDKTLLANGSGELLLNDPTDYNFILDSKKLSFKSLSKVLNLDLDYIYN